MKVAVRGDGQRERCRIHPQRDGGRERRDSDKIKEGIITTYSEEK